jgi:hypothetical protein
MALPLNPRPLTAASLRGHRVEDGHIGTFALIELVSGVADLRAQKKILALCCKAFPDIEDHVVGRSSELIDSYGGCLLLRALHWRDETHLRESCHALVAKVDGPQYDATVGLAFEVEPEEEPEEEELEEEEEEESKAQCVSCREAETRRLTAEIECVAALIRAQQLVGAPSPQALPILRTLSDRLLRHFGVEEEPEPRADAMTRVLRERAEAAKTLARLRPCDRHTRLAEEASKALHSHLCRAR